MKNQKFLILTAVLALSVFCFFSNRPPLSFSVASAKGQTAPHPSSAEEGNSRPSHLQRRGQGEVSDSSSTAFVSRVVDGDTVKLSTGEKVRYIGMNTPETVDPRRPVQCFGKEASAYNKILVLNKKVKLVKDVSETDKYGRLLRYVYLEDGTFVNLKLVSAGYARVDTFPPDVARKADFVKAERQAKKAGLGLWSKCK